MIPRIRSMSTESAGRFGSTQTLSCSRVFTMGLAGENSSDTRGQSTTAATISPMAMITGTAERRDNPAHPVAGEGGSQTLVAAGVGFAGRRARRGARFPPLRLLLFAVIRDQHSRPG